MWQWLTLICIFEVTLAFAFWASCTNVHFSPSAVIVHSIAIDVYFKFSICFSTTATGFRKCLTQSHSMSNGNCSLQLVKIHFGVELIICPSSDLVSAKPLSSTHLCWVKQRLHFKCTIVTETTQPDCKFDHSPLSDFHMWSVAMATYWKDSFLRLCCVWGLAGHCNLDIIFSLRTARVVLGCELTAPWSACTHEHKSPSVNAPTFIARKYQQT